MAEKAMVSPLYLHSSDGPENLITNVQLKGENYEDWAKHVRNASRTKQKLGFIDGTLEKPTKEDDMEQWEVVNTMLVAWIMNTFEPTVRTSISRVEEAQVLWDDLKLTFSPGNEPALRRHVGILHVKVVKAVVQRKKVQMGMINPYVQIELSEDKISSKKTTVKHKNLNPEWNEEFKFSVRDPKTQVLEFNVYGWEKIGKHDKMGMNVLALKELAPDERKAFTLELRKTLDGGEEGQPGKYRGKLEVELLYKPFTEEEMQAVQKAPEGTPVAGGMLVVIVHSAEDVEGKHHTNPYVHIYFKGEERKTKNVKKNKDPKWNEEFSFMLEEPPVHEKLHVEVFSTSSRIGLLHPKETLGYVDIPVVDVVNNKRMNQKFHLIDSKNGKIQIELDWQTAF
ncbi:C2 domain [Arabidopsis thaliana x Arabidopsis arenosa]|uniref:C2 domain n=1 Tax=Arabidopsis thaliana x Arabidopsis arenosa TaxID=1240361 RepID=A0A8T2FPW5_9BRAS|nr:C2 domain [Arabidopsis thaliana x Arabidopsis arenosa]